MLSTTRVGFAVISALIGIPFGKHKVKCRLTDGRKSWEGSAAMLLASFLCGFGMLSLGQKMALPCAAYTAGIAALLGTAAELVTPSEYDTMTVPMTVAAVLLLITSGIG